MPLSSTSGWVSVPYWAGQTGGGWFAGINIGSSPLINVWYTDADNAGNIYVYAQYQQTYDGFYPPYVAKFNADGTVAWQKIITGFQNVWDNGYPGNGQISVSPSGDYVAVTSPNYQTDIGAYAVSTFLLNGSDGSVIWQRLIRSATASAGTGNLKRPLGVDVNNSGTVIVGSIEARQFFVGATGINADAIVFSVSGLIVWQSSIKSNDLRFSMVAIDNSGEFFVGGDNPATGSYASLFKYSAGGSILWSNSWSSVLFGSNGVVGSSGSLYARGQTTVTKIDSSGSFVWAKIFGTNAGVDLNNVAVDESEQVYFSNRGIIYVGDSDGNSVRNIQATTGSPTRYLCVASKEGHAGAVYNASGMLVSRFTNDGSGAASSTSDGTRTFTYNPNYSTGFGSAVSVGSTTTSFTYLSNSSASASAFTVSDIASTETLIFF